MSKVQELKMKELKNLFFYTFGIVPLHYYNVVGDGITDNRKMLQQAIYDAIEVGAKYIFVPGGEYYYSNSLEKANEVIWIGNNVRATIEGIDIRQFPDIWSEAQSKTGAIIPIGGIILTATKNIPTNYLECNGQTINVADYSPLYYAITDNIPETLPTIFNVPNLSTGTEGTKYIIRAK